MWASITKHAFSCKPCLLQPMSCKQGSRHKFSYFPQHSITGFGRRVVIRFLVMSLNMNSSACYLEIPQTFCLSADTVHLFFSANAQGIFQFFVFLLIISIIYWKEGLDVCSCVTTSLQVFQPNFVHEHEN